MFKGSRSGIKSAKDSFLDSMGDGLTWFFDKVTDFLRRVRDHVEA